MTDETPVNKAELLARIQQGWDEFNAYLDTLTEQQLTIPTDAAGWTAKDHVMHLAVWEGGVLALLRGQSRHGYMEVDEDTWQSRDFDRINAVIQQRHRDKSPADVVTALREVHQQMVEKLQSLTDEDLLRPYHHYDPTSTQDRPVINWIMSDTYEHYAEHTPWIAAIVSRASSED